MKVVFKSLVRIHELYPDKELLFELLILRSNHLMVTLAKEYFATNGVRRRDCKVPDETPDPTPQPRQLQQKLAWSAAFDW